MTLKAVRPLPYVLTTGELTDATYDRLDDESYIIACENDSPNSPGFGSMRDRIYVQLVEAALADAKASIDWEHRVPVDDFGNALHWSDCVRGLYLSTHGGQPWLMLAAFDNAEDC